MQTPGNKIVPVCERGQERRDGGDESGAGVVVHILELFMLNLKLTVYCFFLFYFNNINDKLRF